MHLVVSHKFLERLWVCESAAASARECAAAPVCVGHSLLLPAALHHGLVLAHPQPAALHDAGPFGPGLVLVVGVALQVLPAEPGLLLVVWLLLLVRHAFPPGACRHGAPQEWVQRELEGRKPRQSLHISKGILHWLHYKTVQCAHRFTEILLLFVHSLFVYVLWQLFTVPVVFYYN